MVATETILFSDTWATWGQLFRKQDPHDYMILYICHCWVMIFIAIKRSGFQHDPFKLASQVAPQPYRHANLRALCEGPGRVWWEEMTSNKHVPVNCNTEKYV